MTLIVPKTKLKTVKRWKIYTFSIFIFLKKKNQTNNQKNTVWQHHLQESIRVQRSAREIGNVSWPSPAHFLVGEQKDVHTTALSHTLPGQRHSPLRWLKDGLEGKNTRKGIKTQPHTLDLILTGFFPQQGNCFIVAVQENKNK